MFLSNGGTNIATPINSGLMAPDDSKIYLQAHLGNNIAATTFVSGNSNVVADTRGTGNWQFYVAGNTSVAAITGTSNSTEWTVGNLLSYDPGPIVLSYSFDTTTQTGSTVKNTTTNSYDLTLYNGATIATASPAPNSTENAGYLSINVTSGQYAQSSATLPLSQPFSISFWFKRSGTGPNVSATMFEMGDSNLNAIRYSDNNVVASHSNGSQTETGALYSLYYGDANWHHLVFVLNSGSLYSYGDGSLSRSMGTQNYNVTSNFTYFSFGKSYIFPNPTSGTTCIMNIDKFQIFNTALSGTQITALYNGTYIPPTPTLKHVASGATWISKPSIAVDSTETNYTIKSNEIALTPGTNSTYAVWTAAKSTNLKIDVSFADYHSRSAGVGFQMFKIKSDNTFDSVLFPRTVTTTALTNANSSNSSNYLPVPTVLTSVSAGDKIYLRVDANGNTTAASSVLATTIFTDAVSIANNPVENRSFQANLAANLNSAILVSGNSNTVLDTAGTSNWKFYVAGNTSVASITGASNSTEWTSGNLLSYDPGSPIILNYSFDTTTQSGNTIKNLATNDYGLTLMDGATIATASPAPYSTENAGYLSMNVSSGQYATSSVPLSFTNPWTISFWHKFTGTHNGDPTIFEIGNTNGFGLRISSGDYWKSINSYKNGTQFDGYYYANEKNANWNHYALVFSGTGYAGYYNATTGSNFGGFPVLNVASDFTYMNFGKSNMSSVTNPNTGTWTIQIDKFQIFNTRLSLSDITAIYNGTYISPINATLKDTVTGVAWKPVPGSVVDASETNYTVKSNEIALTPGTNSTYAVWTAPKSTNIRVDVSFADYHTRNVGVGFQMFKINSDNTFGSVIFPRTVTSTALTNAAPNNYLSVPSKTISVTTGDKIYLRVDANGNTTSASSVLSTNIYVDPNQDLKQPNLLQAHLGNNMAATTFVSGNSNVVADTRGTGSWKFYVAGGNSIASVTGASNSTEWTAGSLLTYSADDYSVFYPFNTNTVSGSTVLNAATNAYDLTLYGGASIINTVPSPATQPLATGSGYLSMNTGTGQYAQATQLFSLNQAGSTISLWFRWTSNVSNAPIFSYDDGTSYVIFYMWGEDWCVIHFKVGGVSNGWYSFRRSQQGITIGNWVHLTFLTATGQSFVNGVLSLQPYGPGPTAFTQPTKFYLGNSSASPTFIMDERDFVTKTGTIDVDNFVIYNKTLTATEIMTLYAKPDLYFPLDVADINPGNPLQVGDLASGSYLYTGTLVGGATIAVDAGSRVAGKGYLKATSTAHIMSLPPVSTGANGLTFALWFKMPTNRQNVALFDFNDGGDANNQITVQTAYVNETLGTGPRFFTIVGGSGAGDIYVGPFSEWTHFVFVLTPPGNFTTYVNGSLHKAITGYNYPISKTRVNHSILNWKGSTQVNNAGVDDFRFYQRAITAAEISYIYAGPPQPTLKDDTTGVAWMPIPATPVISSETSYTVKNNEIALKPGTNSTFAVWTATKSTNIKVDVSFADYHTRSSAGVGFQMFKIKSDNTFDSVLFPRTVTSTALTNASPNNYLPVPSVSTSVSAGDKIYLRVDANGNTTAASSILATTIFTDAISIATNPVENRLLQAHLGNNLNATSFVSGNANTVLDTLGTSNWQFYAASSTSVAAITSSSASSEWTGGSLLSYDLGNPLISSYSFDTTTQSGNTIKNTTTNSYDLTLINGATIGTVNPSPYSSLNSGYLTFNMSAGQYATSTTPVSFSRPFTISVWVRYTGTYPTITGSVRPSLIEIGDAAGNAIFMNATNFSTIGLFLFFTGGVFAGQLYYRPTSGDASVWNHYVLTFNGVNNTAASYQNGVLYDSQTITWNAPASFTYLNFGKTDIPSESNPTTGSWTPCIDKFQIFKISLSASQVSSLYNNTFVAVDNPTLKNTVAGVIWKPFPATVVDDTETSYTVKSNEIALTPGTNSTYAVWTSPKTTNIKVDVSFADYHTRNVGVGFQMFKINADNTFGSVIYPRTVTSTALTNAAPTNYLSVPSKTISVATGDKLYYRVDANGNTTAASSVLATTIYVDPNQDLKQYNVLQANLANNIATTSFVSGNANVVNDTRGTGSWKFYAAGGNSIASITGASNSTEWTTGSLLSYAVPPTDFSLYYRFNSDVLSGNTISDYVSGNSNATLTNGAETTQSISIKGSGSLDLSTQSGTGSSSKHLRLPTFTISQSTGFSVSFWIYQLETANPMFIFDFATGTTESNNNMVFVAQSYGFDFYPNRSSAGGFTILNTMLLNQWVHISIAIGTTNYVTIYKNASAIYSGTPSANSFLGTAKTFAILGASYSPYSGFKGYIDDFRIFNRELTIAEVSGMYSSSAIIKDFTTGATWIAETATPIDASEGSYTVKNNEVALTPGTNSTFAVWTATKTSNLKVDVSFADYHSRSAGVGFQMFKIKSDNTFDSVLFPRTVTSTALTNAAPNNYLSVPSVTTTVIPGDKIYIRVDANGNTTAASSVLATNIYTDAVSIAINPAETRVLQANLASNLNATTFVSGNSNAIADTIGTGDWKLYVAGNTSVASITSTSASSEWTGGSLLSYLEDYYVLYYNFDTTLVSGSNVYNTASNTYDATLVNSTVVTTSPSPSVFGTDRGYLVCTAANYLQINGTYRTGLTGTSIATWINVNGAGGDIFKSSDGTQSSIQLYVSGGTSIALTVSNNAGDGYYSSTLYTNAAVNNGSWHHVVLILTPVFALSTTFTNSSGNSGLAGGVARWQLFFDGVSVFDNTWGNINAKYPDYIVRGTNKIGPITALIDDFRVYDMALTTADIAVLNSRFSSWYKFNSATGNNTYDSMSGNTAVLSGGASIQTTTPSPVGGGYVSLSSALQQYITIPSFTVTPANPDINSAVGHSFFFKTELSNSHKILTSFSISQLNSYITFGIVGNSVYINMNLTNGIAYTAGGGTFQGGFTTFSNLTSNAGGDIAVSVDDKIMVTHTGFNASVAQSILVSNYSGSTWGVPTSIGSMTKLWNLAMTSDGKRIVATQKGGYVFVSTWNGTSYSAFTQTSDATSRTYTGLGMTADGSRIVCCTNETGPSGNVFMALWNEATNNYNAFTTIVTGISTSIGYDTMCISVDGYKIAYSSGTTCYWASWNGTAYAQQTSFTCVTALNMKFTIDANILLMTTNSATSAIYSVFFNGTTFLTLTAFGGTTALLNKNLLGFHVNFSKFFYLSENGVVGGPYRNTVYWGTTYRTYRCNTITDNNWHNIYFNFYSPYYFEYWFDGTNLTATDVLTNVDPEFNSFYKGKLITTNYIGRSLNSPLTFFDGSIDDFRFYNNRRLSTAEASFLMTGKMNIPKITAGASGPTWMPTPATLVDSSETLYTVKSNEIAMKPGTNSTFAVWTAPKSTNIRVDVSFADYHSRSSSGVGFQMFKINSDNTFGSTIFPRTVTSTALTNAAPTNYLNVPSVSLSVTAGDKVYYRIDANGNTTAASSVISTNIYSYSGKWN